MALNTSKCNHLTLLCFKGLKRVSAIYKCTQCLQMLNLRRKERGTLGMKMFAGSNDVLTESVRTFVGAQNRKTSVIISYNTEPLVI